MIIRAYEREDEPTIKALRDRFHPDVMLPPNGIIQGVIEKDSSIVAYGVVATFAEAVMVMNLDLSLRERYDIVHTLMDGAIMGTRTKDVVELHVTVTDPKWGKVLERQYGFKPVVGALVLEV